MTNTAPRFRINRHRRLAWWGSALACALSLLGLALCWLDPGIRSPLKPGLDFTSGTRIQLQRDCGSTCSGITAPELQQQVARLTLPEDDGQPAPKLSSSTVQVLDSGRSLQLRVPALSPAQSQALIDALEPSLGPFSGNEEDKSDRVKTIGPTLGSRLLSSSLISLGVSFAAIAAYISFRYSGLFALLALVCLAHDVLITCGLFAWLGLLRGVEVDSLFAVALITVAGYSVTDTVVVFDRIREQKTTLAQLPLAEQVDVAVDATLTRSLYTSLTTLLPLFGLIFFGGSSLFWFAIALAVGIAVGSWSSIGLAPTLLPLLSRS